MAQKFSDKLIIQAIGFGSELTARQAMNCWRTFLSGLETVSPWRRPFVVSGTTAMHSYMPIAEDLSDFESVVMTALADYDDMKYLNEDEPDNYHLGVNSKCHRGFTVSFSNLSQKKEKVDNSVNVKLRTQGHSFLHGGKIPLNHELTMISVYSYNKHEVNELWGHQDVVTKVMDYIIDFASPIHCCVYGNVQDREVWNADHDNYKIGWLTYTRNRQFMDVLAIDRRAAPYKGGVLLKLGEGVETIEDNAVVAEILDIRAKLRSAGVTEWWEL